MLFQQNVNLLYKLGGQKIKEKKKINKTIAKNAKISEFIISEEGSSSNFGNWMIDEIIVREEQQPSTTLQNQTETTTEPKQSYSDNLNSDIISTYEVRANYLFIFFSILFAM